MSAELVRTSAFTVPPALGPSLREDQPKNPMATSEVKGAGAGRCLAQRAEVLPRPLWGMAKRRAELKGVLYDKEGQRGTAERRNGADFKQGTSRRGSGSASGPAVAAVV